MSHYFLLKSFTKLGALKHDEAFFEGSGECSGGGEGALIYLQSSHNGDYK